MKKNNTSIGIIMTMVLMGFIFVPLTLMSFNTPESTPETFISTVDMKEQQAPLLRHVVLFKFKPGTSKADITKVETAFSALPSKISQIADYEWGLNNSPEGLNKGFTHCFFVTFKSEADRAIYLPHPDHKAFVAILEPHLEDATVVDYWTK